MSGFNTFSVEAVFASYLSNFNHKDGGFEKLLNSVAITDNLANAVIAIANNRDSVELKVRCDLGNFTCRNSAARELTKALNLTQIITKAALKGFIIRIVPTKESVKETLKFLKEVDIVQEYLKIGDVFYIYCKGGNSVGLTVGLLRDFPALNNENILKHLIQWTDYLFFIQCKQRILPEKYINLSINTCSFLSTTNREGKSIHDSWSDYLSENVSMHNVELYFDYILEYLKTDSYVFINLDRGVYDYARNLIKQVKEINKRGL